MRVIKNNIYFTPVMEEHGILSNRKYHNMDQPRKVGELFDRLIVLRGFLPEDSYSALQYVLLFSAIFYLKAVVNM